MLNTKLRGMMADARDALTEFSPARLRKARPFIPYCWAHDGTGALTLVNRQYKPLGVLNALAERVDYADYPDHRIDGPEALPAEAIAMLNPSCGNLYFFGFADRWAPWQRKADARRLIAIIDAHLHTCPARPQICPTAHANHRGAISAPLTRKGQAIVTAGIEYNQGLHAHCDRAW